jgi:hypothetical protein
VYTEHLKKTVKQKGCLPQQILNFYERGTRYRMKLWPNIVGTTGRAFAGVSCGQFGTVRLKFKLSTYIQETVGAK